jgi:hypothetical protein
MKFCTWNNLNFNSINTWHIPFLRFFDTWKNQRYSVLPWVNSPVPDVPKESWIQYCTCKKINVSVLQRINALVLTIIKSKIPGSIKSNIPGRIKLKFPKESNLTLLEESNRKFLIEPNFVSVSTKSSILERIVRSSYFSRLYADPPVDVRPPRHPLPKG